MSSSTKHTTIFECGCEYSYKPVYIRHLCPVHKTRIKAVRGLCSACGEVFYPKSMRGSPLFCTKCRTAKESPMSREELDAGDRIDGWDCKCREKCLDVAINKKVSMLPCKGCERYERQALDIIDYITATDLFANDLFYLKEA